MTPQRCISLCFLSCLSLPIHELSLDVLLFKKKKETLKVLSFTKKIYTVEQILAVQVTLAQLTIHFFTLVLDEELLPFSGNKSTCDTLAVQSICLCTSHYQNYHVGTSRPTQIASLCSNALSTGSTHYHRTLSPTTSYNEE